MARAAGPHTSPKARRKGSMAALSPYLSAVHRYSDQSLARRKGMVAITVILWDWLMVTN